MARRDGHVSGGSQDGAFGRVVGRRVHRDGARIGGGIRKAPVVRRREGHRVGAGTGVEVIPWVEVRGGRPVAEIPQDAHRVAVGVADGAGEGDAFSLRDGDVSGGGQDGAVGRLVGHSALGEDLASDLSGGKQLGVNVHVELSHPQGRDESVPIARQGPHEVLFVDLAFLLQFPGLRGGPGRREQFGHHGPVDSRRAQMNVARRGAHDAPNLEMEFQPAFLVLEGRRFQPSRKAVVLLLDLELEADRARRRRVDRGHFAGPAEEGVEVLLVVLLLFLSEIGGKEKAAVSIHPKGLLTGQREPQRERTHPGDGLHGAALEVHALQGVAAACRGWDPRGRDIQYVNDAVRRVEGEELGAFETARHLLGAAVGTDPHDLPGLAIRKEGVPGRKPSGAPLPRVHHERRPVGALENAPDGVESQQSPVRCAGAGGHFGGQENGAVLPHLGRRGQNQAVDGRPGAERSGRLRLGRPRGGGDEGEGRDPQEPQRFSGDVGGHE